VAAFAVAYFVTACPHVLGADNGEFATIFAEGGGAHPPGYPLYALYLRAMSWMPGVNAAEASARATALLGGAAIALSYFACRAWGASRAAAIVSVGLFGVWRVAWEQFTQAEAFALNSVLCAAFLAVAGPEGRLSGARRLIVLGALTGLGAAHHHTLATLAPIGVLAGARALRHEGARLRDLGLAILAALAGVSAYLYPVLVARHPAGRWIWGEPTDLTGVVHLFLRWDYWTTRQGPRGSSEQVQALASGMGEAFAQVGLVLAAVGLLVMALRFAGRKSAWPDAMALLASVGLAGPLLLMQFEGRPIGIGHAISERFYLLPALLLCVAMARGVGLLIDGRRRPRTWAAAALTALALYHALLVRERVREETRPTIDRYARNILSSVPQGAVIAGNGDIQIFTVLYMQHAEHRRTDVTYLDVGMLALPWYGDEPSQKLGLSEAAASNLPRLCDEVLDGGRSLFFTTPDFVLPPRFVLLPFGALFRVVRDTEKIPPVEQLEAENLAIAKTFAWDETPVKDRWSWFGVTENAYRATWLAIADKYTALGRPDDAKRNALRAARGSLGP
jgi:hypothetical protein